MSVNQLSGGVRGFVAEVTQEGRLQTQVANTVATAPAGFSVNHGRVSVSTSSVTLAAFRADRRQIHLKNVGANPVYVRFDGAAATTDDWPLAPGEEFRGEDFASEDAIKGISESSGTTVVVLDMA